MSNAMPFNPVKWLKPPSPCLNRSFAGITRRLQAQASPSILDLGSGGRFIHEKIISLDLICEGHISVVADSAHLPFKNRSFSFILCTAVLEHVTDVHSTLQEIKRCLAMDGEIYIDVPFMQPFHADPNDFRRFTLIGLRQIMQSYEHLDSGVSVGPFSGLAMYMRKIPASFFHGLPAMALEAVAGWLTFWIKYFDYVIPMTRNAHGVASALFFHGKRVLDTTSNGMG
jgi:SAM-dependent methyltransferase